MSQKQEMIFAGCVGVIMALTLFAALVFDIGRDIGQEDFVAEWRGWVWVGFRTPAEAFTSIPPEGGIVVRFLPGDEWIIYETLHVPQTVKGITIRDGYFKAAPGFDRSIFVIE